MQNKKLDNIIKEIVIKDFIDKQLKRRSFAFRKVVWLVNLISKDKDYSQRIGMRIATTKIYEKHRNNTRAKLHRVRKSPRVIGIQEKYPNLKVIEALQLLSLYGVELHKVSKIGVFEIMLDTLFNEVGENHISSKD